MTLARERECPLATTRPTKLAERRSEKSAEEELRDLHAVVRAPEEAAEQRPAALREAAEGTPAARPAHDSCTGHSAQFGRRGRQRVAPRSIIPCAKSPYRKPGAGSGGKRLPASARSLGFALGKGVWSAKRRALTRSTLPSTTLARWPSAMAATSVANASFGKNRRKEKRSSSKSGMLKFLKRRF